MSATKITKPARYLALPLALILLNMTFICAGCSDGMNTTPTSPRATQTQTQATHPANQPLSLDIIVQKVFPKVGFRLLLVVTDENGQFVKFDGEADAKIWIQSKDSSGNWITPAQKEKLIYEWSSVAVSQEGYMQYEGEDVTAEGIPVVLEWGDFHLISDQGINIEEDALCTIGITLNLNDGTALTAEEENINILIKFTCC